MISSKGYITYNRNFLNGSITSTVVSDVIEIENYAGEIFRDLVRRLNSRLKSTL